MEVENTIHEIGLALRALVFSFMKVTRLVEAVNIVFRIGLALFALEVMNIKVTRLVDAVNIAFKIGLALLALSIARNVMALVYIITIGPLMRVVVLLEAVGLMMQRMATGVYMEKEHILLGTFRGMMRGEVDLELEVTWPGSMAHGMKLQVV